MQIQIEEYKPGSLRIDNTDVAIGEAFGLYNVHTGFEGEPPVYITPDVTWAAEDLIAVRFEKRGGDLDGSVLQAYCAAEFLFKDAVWKLEQLTTRGFSGMSSSGTIFTFWYLKV